MKINSKKFLLMSVSVLVLFVLFVTSYKYDQVMINYNHKISSDILDFWMLFITNFGNVLTFLVITLFSLIVLDYRKGKRVLYCLITGFSSSMLLKYIIERPRPLTMLIEEFGFSFPSAHALISLVFYGYLCYLMNKSNARKIFKYLFNFIAIVVVLGIGFSRIYLQVHYLSDVIGGYLFGLIILFIYIYFSSKKVKMKDETIRLDNSFRYAYRGIKDVIINEKNMHIHIIAVICVITLGTIVDLSITEWLICLIMFALVLSAEIFNTAIEKTVDYISKERNEQAKLIKDMAAGAVLINAIIAATVGIIIFVPKLLVLFGH